MTAEERKQALCEKYKMSIEWFTYEETELWDLTKYYETEQSIKERIQSRIYQLMEDCS